MGAEILAVAGTLSSGLVMVGGYLTKRHPVLGPRLVGAAGGVMLLGNLAVLALKLVQRWM